MPVNDFLKKFLDYLRGDLRRSPKTLEAYDLYLTRFFEWLKREKIVALEKIDGQTIGRYKKWLKLFKSESGKRLSAKTFNYHLIALRMLFVFLRRKNSKLLAPELITLGAQERSSVAFLNDRELVKLLDAPMSEMEVLPEKVSIQLRDKAILEFLFATGAKMADTIKLKRIDLKKFRIGQQAQYWLKKYLSSRGDKLPYLFVSYDRASAARNKSELSVAALTPRSLQRIVRRHAMAAGLDKKVTPQVLRNTFARRLLADGATIKEIKKGMDFSSDLAAKLYIDSLKRERGRTSG
jgi:site-specific recombinase XerD